MPANVFVNVGTCELLIDGEEPPRTHIRVSGEELLSSCDAMAPRITYPRVEASLDYIARQAGDGIGRLVLIGTDQADDSSPSRAGDTVYYTQILAKLIPERYGDRIQETCYKLIGTDPPLDPHVYDETFDIYGQILRAHDCAEASACYLLPLGGFAACRTSLLLQGIRVFGDRARVLYHRKEDGETWPLQVGQQFLQMMHESTAIDMLDRFDFPAALRLVQDTSQADPLALALLRYGSARLRFELDQANASLEEAIALSQGEIRRQLQEIRHDFLRLPDGDEQARIGELYHNARIAWDKGRYVSFLGRLIRFQGAVMIYLVNRVYDTDIDRLKDTFSSLAVRPDLRHFVLDTLEYRAGLTIRPIDDPDQRAEQLKQLRLILNDHFSLGELADLCFDLGIDCDDLPGHTRSDKARELVEYSVRHGFLAELLTACQERRPRAPWGEIQTVEAVDSVSFATVCAALRRIDRLVPLRNASIIGYGYRGVSEEIIMREYNSDSAEAMLSPVEDMAIICTALDISTVNPFRDIRDLIVQRFADMKTA